MGRTSRQEEEGILKRRSGIELDVLIELSSREGVVF
jgi:hypothetical protein